MVAYPIVKVPRVVMLAFAFVLTAFVGAPRHNSRPRRARLRPPKN